MIKAEDINSIESEAGVIATLIHHPDWCFFSETLLPNHFTEKTNRCLYLAITDLAKRGIKTIDPYNIIEDLNASEATRRFSSDLKIEQLYDLIEMSDILSRSSLEEYKLLVNNVLDAAFRRDAFQKLKECEAFCYDRSVDNVEKKIYDAIDEVMTEFSVAEDIPEFSDVVDELWSDVELHQDGVCSGIPFKFPTLNEYVVLEPGELVIVGAPAKGAKSMFMLNEAVDIMKQGKTLFYIDSELSSRLFLCRMISHLSGIEFQRIKNGCYNEEEKKTIYNALGWIKKQRFVHLYMPFFDQQTVYTAVKKISHKFGKLDVLIVDYFKSTGDGDGFDTYQQLGNFVNLVKNEICGGMNIAGLGAAQLASTGNKLADSAKIARNASTILMLLDKTPEEVDQYGAETGTKKLVVQLNRNGMQHSTANDEWIDIAFNGNLCLLEEAKKQHIPDYPY